MILIEGRPPPSSPVARQEGSGRSLLDAWARTETWHYWNRTLMREDNTTRGRVRTVTRRLGWRLSPSSTAAGAKKLQATAKGGGGGGGGTLGNIFFLFCCVAQHKAHAKAV